MATRSFLTATTRPRAGGGREISGALPLASDNVHLSDARIGWVGAHGVRRPLDAARYARNRPRSLPSFPLPQYVARAGVLWAEVDYVDAVAGVEVRVVGEHHRGGGAGLVDDLRDL